MATVQVVKLLGSIVDDGTVARSEAAACDSKTELGEAFSWVMGQSVKQSFEPSSGFGQDASSISNVDVPLSTVYIRYRCSSETDCTYRASHATSTCGSGNRTSDSLRMFCNEIKTRTTS